MLFRAPEPRPGMSGRLSLMCRLAGGQAPSLYGPNREETAAMKAAALQAK